MIADHPSVDDGNCRAEVSPRIDVIECLAPVKFLDHARSAENDAGKGYLCD
jgi:hypothetical protein